MTKGYLVHLWKVIDNARTNLHRQLILVSPSIKSKTKHLNIAKVAVTHGGGITLYHCFALTICLPKSHIIPHIRV